jgi:hypothetical protein
MGRPGGRVSYKRQTGDVQESLMGFIVRRIALKAIAKSAAITTRQRFSLGATPKNKSTICGSCVDMHAALISQSADGTVLTVDLNLVTFFNETSIISNPPRRQRLNWTGVKHQE